MDVAQITKGQYKMMAETYRRNISMGSGAHL